MLFRSPGWLTVWAGGRLKLLQTGRIGNYALMMVVGLLLLGAFAASFL